MVTKMLQPPTQRLIYVLLGIISHFFILLYSVTRLIPNWLAVRVRLKPFDSNAC